MSKPSLSRLWAAFPDHQRYPTLRDLYTMMGGVAEQNIYAKGFGPKGNTCASRLSHAFNEGGAPISAAVARTVGAETIGTAKGQRVIFRVEHFRKYLRATLGVPQSDTVRPFDDNFRSKRGIISFTVEGWNDATGHIALIDHGRYREASDNYASLALGPVRTIRGDFWVLN